MNTIQKRKVQGNLLAFCTSKPILSIVLISSFMWHAPANANLFAIDFSSSGTFSGTAPPLPPASDVFARALFDDGGGTGTVTLTMSVYNNLTVGAYVNDWYFNVANNTALSIEFISGIAAPTVVNTPDSPSPSLGEAGKFDFAFNFYTSNPGDLGRGFNSVYKLTGADIDAFSFNAPSLQQGTSEVYVGAIHAQGYGDSVKIAGEPNQNPDPIPTPEPSSLALLGLGLIVSVFSLRRRSLQA